MPPIPPGRISFLGGGSEDALQAAEWFMAMRSRPSAGIVFSCGLCDLFRQQLSARGPRCPEDVSLITKVWEGVSADTTCLRGSAIQMGELAVDALLDRATGRRQVPLRLAMPSQLERGRTVRQMG